MGRGSVERERRSSPQSHSARSAPCARARATLARGGALRTRRARRGVARDGGAIDRRRARGGSTRRCRAVARERMLGHDAASLALLWPALAARAGATLDRRGTERLAAFTTTQRTAPVCSSPAASKLLLTEACSSRPAKQRRACRRGHWSCLRAYNSVDFVSMSGMKTSFRYGVRRCLRRKAHGAGVARRRSHDPRGGDARRVKGLSARCWSGRGDVERRGP